MCDAGARRLNGADVDRGDCVNEMASRSCSMATGRQAAPGDHHGRASALSPCKPLTHFPKLRKKRPAVDAF